MHATKEIMTGREAEEGFLGSVDNANTKYRAALLRRGIPEGLLQNMSGRPLPHISFRDALEIAKIGQPWKDPANPEKDFLRELRIEIADRLGIGADKEALDRLRVYTAVGSPLDLLHGVDAFFEFDKKNGTRLWVFLDITNAPAHKQEKLGVMIVDANAIGDPAENEREYQKSIEALAAEIAMKFRTAEARELKIYGGIGVAAAQLPVELCSEIWLSES